MRRQELMHLFLASPDQGFHTTAMGEEPNQDPLMKQRMTFFIEECVS